MSYAAALRGVAAPSPNKQFTYCDLGCGNGVTVNLLAASFPHATFYGIDFNPEHIANARALAQKAGLKNVSFLDASFEEMQRIELPGFDYIALHGVYSWVNADIRSQIHDVVDQFLNPGGLLYLCYYTHPGASELLPLWKLLQSYMSNLEGDLVSKAQTALQGMLDSRRAGSRFFRENPYANRYVDKLTRRDIRFFIHEFCNGAFEPQFFSDVANGFAKQGLSFAASARLDHNKMENLVQRRNLERVEQAGDPVERETRLGFARNESFRWDIFAREGGADHQDLDSWYFGARASASNLKGKVAAGRREIDLEVEPYQTLLKVASPGTLTLAEMAAHPDLAKYDGKELRSCLHDLVATDSLQPQLTPAASVRPEQGTLFRFSHPVSRAFIEDSLFSEGKVYVASPVTGSAMRLGFANGLFAMLSDGVPLSSVPGLVQQRLNALEPAERLRLLGDEGEVTEAWVKRAGMRFVTDYFPRMVQQEIFVPT